MIRQFTLFEQLIAGFDTALRTLHVPKHRISQRPNPGTVYEKPELTPQEQKHVAGLMRVNHSGEVCAQALYQGQGLTAKLHQVKAKMAEAAAEEVEHLAWCEQRLQELHSHPSRLNPLWYGGSFFLGALAGLLGDRWSLGFVAETEQQVTAHLKRHLQQLPSHDLRSKAILNQMQQDETQHAEMAWHAGAENLPWLVKQGMHCVSKFMTYTSYYL